MEIKIRINGHQHYEEHTGEPLAWMQCVEYYGSSPMQVPAVLLRTDESVLLIPLQSELRQVSVSVLRGDA